ncbi:TPA: restriction endonuclease subunit S [Vibrio cholerae]|uniref:restriction endonuclease subunit S n=1 Tax=Vibrio cholerae TaxID=666 RepID=UPI001582C486|nr:restriction endonuclease subunit S [Vibrio cholerae]QKU63632.1 restriction endonuclease subunit S [Vibrio cholerae]QKU67515.1 restriction endonuclease subunit S [Vibrio cholerae]
MGSDAKFVQLGSLCSQVLTGGTPLTKNKHFYDGGTIPWLKTKEVNFNFIESTENYITEAGLAGSSAKLVPVNSVIVAMYGQGDTAGRVAVNKIPVTTNQACCNLVIDPLKADYRFVYYYLKSSYSELVRRKTGSAQPNLNTKILKDFEIVDLPLARQTAIGDQLEALDQKITLNRQINQTLEQMAQTLFKSWFVDFDPVMDNALDAGNPIPDELQHRAEARKAVREGFKSLPDEVRQLFPDAFEESELGWVPEGWMSGILSDLLVLQRGFDLPKSKRTDGPFPLMAASGQDGTHNEGKVRGPGVVTGRSGKLGVVNLVIEDFWPLNTTLWIKEYPRSNPYHAYFFLQTIPLEQFNSGSAVPTLNRNHVHNRPVTLPSQDVLNKYADLVKDNFTQILNRRIQSETLEKLRDTLLPKLISGELCLDDVELAVNQETVSA